MPRRVREALLTPRVTMRLLREFARRPVAPRLDTVRELTDPELEVLVLVACGLSNAEIAERLVLSLATARRT